MATKEDKLYYSVYNEIYGGLLSDNSSEILRQYFDCDMSLQEIAQQYGITRQAVRDTVVRAQKFLDHCESVLKLNQYKHKISDIVGYSDADGANELRGRLDSIKEITEGNNGSF